MTAEIVPRAEATELGNRWNVEDAFSVNVPHDLVP